MGGRSWTRTDWKRRSWVARREGARPRKRSLGCPQRGLEMTGVQMVEMLTLICEQRVCRRLSVRPVDSLNQTQAALIPPAAEAMPSAAEAAVDAAPVADTVVEMRVIS